MMARPTVLRFKLILAALVQFVVGAYLFRFATQQNVKMWQRLFAGLPAAVFLLFAVSTIWMSTMRISYGHTLTSAYIQFGLSLAMFLTRFPKVKRIQESWKNPREAQENHLRYILQSNSRTKYAREFGLTSVTSLKELREKHPLTTYERYRPYVDRMAKGEQEVLTGEAPVRFALTSGTTGKSKMIPYIQSYFSRVYGDLIGLDVDNISKEFGIGSYLQQEANIYTAPKVRYTEAGILMGPASLLPSSMKLLLTLFSSPKEGFEIYDPADATYVHLLFGLRDRNLRGINCSFTSNLMSTMRLVEQRHQDIVKDIKNGTVTIKNVPPKIHQALVKAMGGGDSERAAELKREFEKGFEGIVERVWPYIIRVQSIDSVGIKSILQNSYIRGVPLYGQALAATEGVLGYNLWPRSEGKDEFVLMPTFAVFEFIPEDKIYEDQPETYLLDELQVGCVYEVVITQIFGLYRFRYGDVVKVKRFHLNTPVVEFMYRSGQILNVHSEKLDQSTVQDAIEAAVRHWPEVTLREYAVAESTLLDQLEKSGSDHRPYYVVFLELHPTPEKDSLSQLSLKKVDEELCQHSFTYKSFREKDSIAPPVVHIVKTGSFDRLHDFILDNSTTTANQYKIPRKLRTTATLELMLESSILKQN